MEEQETTSSIKPKRDEKGRLLPGSTANMGGRPKETEEFKLKKKVMQEVIRDYKETLTAALPEISPVLKKKAIAGDMQAIKEIHDRVMGKSEGEEKSIIPDINIIFSNEQIRRIARETIDGDTTSKESSDSI